MSRLPPMRRTALAATVAVLVAAPASAPAPVAALSAATCAPTSITNFLAADVTKPGVIDLYFFGANGGRVAFFECVDGELRGLGIRTGNDMTLLKDATAWRCDRLTRRFVAYATLPNGSRAAGSYSVRTGSCAKRFDIGVTRRAEPGASVGVRVVDRWGIGGIRPQLCIAPPQARGSCRTVSFAQAVAVATRRFRARTAGDWRIELRVHGSHVRATVAVGRASAPAAPPPTLVATGDSTMKGVDSFLADQLGDIATVRSDIRPGSAISKPNGWSQYARSQVTRFRQSTTVISLGAAEGFPMQTPAGATQPCCAEPWVVEYARRVRGMMRTYVRGGRARVVWLTLPRPRGTTRLPITDAVNAAILRAADGLEGVRVLRMDLLFSPNGFQEVIRYRGRNIPVRTPDGIHLNVPGTAIAANEISDALRRR